MRTLKIRIIIPRHSFLQVHYMEREIDSLIGKHNETISRLDQGIKHITELAVAFEQAGQHDRVRSTS